MGSGIINYSIKDKTIDLVDIGIAILSSQDYIYIREPLAMKVVTDVYEKLSKMSFEEIILKLISDNLNPNGKGKYLEILCAIVLQKFSNMEVSSFLLKLYPEEEFKDILDS